jgi:hypothetical protein
VQVLKRLKRLRVLCAKQIELNEKHAATQKDETIITRSTFVNLCSIVRTEDLGGGATSNASNILGSNNNTYARLYTPSSSQAAQIVAQTCNDYATGEVSVRVKKGPSSSNPPSGVTNYNRVSVWVSNSGNDWDWTYIGTTSIITTANSASSSVKYVAGTTTGHWKYAVVEVNTFTSSSPPAPGATQFNDVMVDSLEFMY